jgi:purine-binding chemotaxis protein CheW
MRPTGLYCTFVVDETHFAINVLEVQEVIEAAQLTPVPLSAKEILGIMNLRGQIVTCLDMRLRLAVEEKATEEQTFLVLAGGAHTVSLIVDHVGDVVNFEDATFHRSPETLSDTVKSLIEGSFESDSQLIHIVNPNEVLRLDRD